MLEILQQEQDRATSFLSSSLLLSSLPIVSSGPQPSTRLPTPSPTNEGWKALHTAITTLQEENEELMLENREAVGKLEAVTTSRESFHPQVLYFEEINATQQDNIKSLTHSILDHRIQRWIPIRRKTTHRLDNSVIAR